MVAVGVPGRPPLDPEGGKSQKTPGIWLSPGQMERLELAVAAVAAFNKTTPAHARRLILMHGADSMWSLIAMGNQLIEGEQ